jgi:hypothetical protein
MHMQGLLLSPVRIHTYFWVTLDYICNIYVGELHVNLEMIILDYIFYL